MDDTRVPVVSVILLCFRQRGTVVRALESVLRQVAPFSFEIVIADDGSDDGTCEVLEDYVASLTSARPSEGDRSAGWEVEIRPGVTVRFLPKRENRGLVLNYFGALRACRGSYISDCAGDDHWVGSSRLREAVSILDENPDVNVVFSDFIIRDVSKYMGPDESVFHPETDRRAYSTERYAPWGRARISGQELIEGLLNREGGLPYLLSAAVYRRDAAIEALRVSERMVCNPEFGCEDLPLMLALAARGDAMFLPEVTMVYYEGGESVSNSGRASKVGAFYLKSMMATRTLADFYAYDRGRMNEWFAKRSRYLASLAFRGGDKELAKKISEELARWSQRPDLRTRLYLCLAGSYRRLRRIALGIKDICRHKVTGQP